MRVEQNVRPPDVPTEDREPEAPHQTASSQGNNPAVTTPGEERPFFPAPDLTATALEAGKIGVWAWDIAANRITWSANLEEIHRLAPGSFDGTFAAFESAVHPDDRAVVTAAFKESLRSQRPHRTLYRLPPQPDDDERWIEVSGAVMVDGGQPTRMVGTCRDVTERVTLHRELRARASHQETIARLGERALTESDLQRFFDEAVAMIAKILDVELVKILEVVPGDAELLLRSGVGWNEGLVGTAYVSTGRETQAGFTLASGGPVIVENLATETRFVGAQLLRDHDAVSGISTPIAGRDGRAYGVLTVHTRRRRKFSEYEVSFLASLAAVIAGAIARLHQDRRQELMIRELRHRSGNLYSQLLALFSQTAKNSKNVADLTKKYAARVLALANAHRLITEGGWKSASLMELLNTLLAPHIDRVTFAGPNVFLDPDATFGLSMAVHELSSNASQHGSLSNRAGTVEVTWQVNRTERGLTLAFDWKEREGPPPKRTRRAGFGTRLINMVIERQLNGEVKQTFGPEGFDAQLVVPLTHERWPGVTARSVAADNLT
jgi:PAS domain S-box-containing protein